MANRVAPTPPDADNLSGSFMLAACSDWRGGARRFHVGTGHFETIYEWLGVISVVTEVCSVSSLDHFVSTNQQRGRDG